MSKTYIIGHQKPDTDSVVAALALEFLYKQDPSWGYQNPEARIVDPLNPETTYLFEKFSIQAPQILTADQINPDDQVVLVDHNEETQRLAGLNPDQIVEIVDHHKANFNFNNPIYLTFKTWGSSATVVYYLMKRNSITPDTKLASLMLCAILSDTVGFKGATTTNWDKKFGLQLAQIAGIEDIEGLALEIFKAKSDVSKLSDEQIVKNDYKIFDFNGKKVFIDQLETVEQQYVMEQKKKDLLEAMSAVKTQEKVDLLFVCITDVLKINSKLLILGQAEQEVAQSAFGGQVTDQVLDIGPKMSRKKEIAPLIEKAVK